MIGLNFCPFAKREVDSERVYYQVSRDQDMEQSLYRLVKECQRLDASENIATTLLILAEGFESFDRYLDLLALANELLVAQGYEGVYQLASFHPDYCFEGESHSDAANYTNRSPYPMLHLIREDSLEKALENYPDPESIPERNKNVARSKGVEKIKEMISKCMMGKET